MSLFVATGVYAQVTTSSMSGKVSEKDGTGVAGATVIATHTPSGTKYYSVTDNNGNYRIPNMRVGGPYEVTATLMGYADAKTDGAYLKLGENFVRNITISEQSVALDAIVVKGGVVNPMLNSDKDGASTNISTAQLRQLPSISRGITDFTSCETHPCHTVLHSCDLAHDVKGSSLLPPSC